MEITRLLIANRGEIAIRIARAATELGIPTVSVHGADEPNARHLRASQGSHTLPGRGAAAYLDGESLIGAAQATGCNAVHPGYGFLSESASFATRCAEAGLALVAPPPKVLALLGDKARARALAAEQGVPVLEGTEASTSLEETRRFLTSLGADGAIMVKAVAGGGGRGIRAVRHPSELEDAYERCRSEARATFGDDSLYVERLVRRPRHVEVQIVGDGSRIRHLWERECTLQRRHQKLVEVAPAPHLDPDLRAALLDAAERMARAVGYAGLGTFEFLIDPEASRPEDAFAFLEANPRIQVEHTVTEEVTGRDLVQAQLRIAGGETLEDLGWDVQPPAEPNGHAIQLRINAERIDETGKVHPGTGRIGRWELPGGPGIRVDTHAHPGYEVHPSFDSLLAKVVVRAPGGSFQQAVMRARRALDEMRVSGLDTNLAFLRALLARPEVLSGAIHTGFVDDNAPELVHAMRSRRAEDEVASGGAAPPEAHGALPEPPAGTIAIRAPMRGRVIEIRAAEGELLRPGQAVAVLEAMKMEHLVEAPTGGVVQGLAAAPGDDVEEAHPLLFVQPDTSGAQAATREAAAPDLDHIRPDLEQVLRRHAHGLDENRPEAVAKRHRRGQRTARENVADLCDEGSFVEYGALAIAAQRGRRPVEELIERTPADGLIAGICTINGEHFSEDRSRTLVLAYDYTVLAGTQGFMNHKKTDRMLALAERHGLPIMLFAEGGGGRPGDTDVPTVAGLDVPTFARYARLSGVVPRIAIVSGRCFAGNAALAGCSDLMVATANTTIGMGGPAMIEGGGLGRYRPEEVGPADMQTPNGVIDLLVDDEAEAVAAARRLLAYFQGPVTDWEHADQRHLRHVIPENRLRVYDVRRVIDLLADRGSTLELRARFAPGMITAFVRIEGQPLGLIANNPSHLAGAIDSPGADKAARFMQLCNAFGIPLLTLCDTPGIMVGPDAERTALVRHASRLFLAGANLSVPVFTVVLRKGYGLGAQAMAGGSFHEPFFNVAWPTGEFGGMGLEGAVRLGFRKELEAVQDPAERQKLFEDMVTLAYEHGKATNMASFLEIDAVIDPVDTRRWIARGLASASRSGQDGPHRSRFVDAW